MLADHERSGLHVVSERSSVRSDRDASHHPRAAIRQLLIGYTVLVLSLLVIGWLLTDVLDGSIGRWDLHVNRWFASHRSDSFNALSGGVTFMLDTFPVIGVAVLAVALFMWRHRLREGLVIAVGLVLEITVFLSVTFVVARPRPEVSHLSSLPMTSSFPSGHTAAAVVLYGGIALGVHACTRSPWIRAVFWTLACIAVIGVGTSRVYRGMHHPTDVAAGALFGAACLWFAWHAVAEYLGRAEPSHEAAPPAGAARLRTVESNAAS